MIGRATGLLVEIEQFLRAQDMPATVFGRRVLGDPRFVFDLRRGRLPREEKARRVRSWMGRHADDPSELRMLAECILSGQVEARDEVVLKRERPGLGQLLASHRVTVGAPTTAAMEAGSYGA